MWNYRIGTKVKNIKLSKKTIRARAFFIFDCYYDEKGIPNSYPARVDELDFPSILLTETLKDLKGNYKLIAEAFDKPVIDLDNFPNEYKKKIKRLKTKK